MAVLNSPTERMNPTCALTGMQQPQERLAGANTVAAYEAEIQKAVNVWASSALRSMSMADSNLQFHTIDLFGSSE